MSNRFSEAADSLFSRSRRETRRRYGSRPRFIVPHNFYYDLGLPGYTPRIEQVFALSSISGYQMADWLRVFGFHLEDIARLQGEFPAERTTVLDRTVYDPAALVGWFADIRCSIEGNTLILQPFADGSSKPERLRNRVDAEVIGKVTALFRSLH